jgi:GntR family transcriptional repressor for pyruvate dehydrogenase complex
MIHQSQPGSEMLKSATIPLLQPNIEHSNQQHEAIVIAILSGDGARAATAMQEHLEGSAALLRGFLG